MSFPLGQFRPLFPWQQDHYANLLLQQQNNASTGRETSSRSTNQTREVTADVPVPRFTDFSTPEQRGMINNNMVMPADSVALVESVRNIYQSGMGGNLTQTRPELQSRGPPPMYNRVPRSNAGTLGHPRGPPPLINTSIRQEHRAKQRNQVSQKSTGNQFRPEIQPQIHQFSAMPPNLNQTSMMPPQFISTSMHNLIRPPLQPHINHTVSRNPIRPDVPNVHDNINTIRITNPFENEVNFPRTRTSPQYPADISSMSHQGNINSQPQMTAPSITSLHGLQNNSTSMNVNSNLLPLYSNSGMSNIDPRLFNSSLFPRQFPLSGYHVENHQMPNIMPGMPVQSSNPFNEFNLLPPSINNNNNPLTSRQNSVRPDTNDDDISDVNVMGRWYKPPSNEDEGDGVSDKTIPRELAPEKTKTTEKVSGKENPPEHGNTIGNLSTTVIKAELDVGEEGMDRIHRPSKQTTHTRLENVVNKLYGDRVVSPMGEIASVFPLTEESTSSDQDVLSYNNITTKSPRSAVQSATTSQISSEQPALETPASIEPSEIAEIQSDVNHVNSSPDMTLCILNTFSLSSSGDTLSQDSTIDGTGTSKETSDKNPTSKRNSGKKTSSSPKKVPPLRIKLPFNKISPKKKGFGNSKKSFGSPVKTAFHHFAKGAKKLIEIRKPKALMFDENQEQNIGKPAISHVTNSDKISSDVISSSNLKENDERSLDDVVAKVKNHRKRRRSAMLLDSTGLVIGESNPKQSAETGNVGKKKKIPKNTKKNISKSVAKCTEKRADKSVKQDKKLVYEDFVIESRENSDCDEEMSNGNDAVLKESTEFAEEGNKAAEGAKEVSDNLSKEERNRDLIEKNWVQIEARLRLVEKRYKEGKIKSPVKSMTSSESTSKINNDNISSQIDTSSKSLSIENKSSPKKKSAEDVTIENKSGSKPMSTENVAIQNKSSPKKKSAEDVTIENKSGSKPKSTENVVIQNKSGRKSKSGENVTIENKSSRKRKSDENVTFENNSSPKRKSDELVNSKKSIPNKSPKEILSNAGSGQSAKRRSPKNCDQTRLSKKKEVTTSAKVKKNSRNSKTVNEKDITDVGDSAYFKMPARYGSDKNGYVSKFGRNRKGNTGEENIDKNDGEKPSKRKKTSDRTNSKNTGEKFSKRHSNCAFLDLSPSENMLRKDVGIKQATKKNTATAGCDLIVGEERVNSKLATSGTVKVSTQTISKVTSPTFFVTFHGKRVLCLNTPSGKLLLMREILRRNFKDLVKSSCNNSEGQYKQVYLAKERDLKITYREIPEKHRSLAFKYLIFEKLLREKKKVPQHLGVISVEDALRLYHYMNGLKACSERCIELWSPPDELEKTEAKGTCSESEQMENRCESRTSSGTGNDGYESDVTIPYIDDSEKGEISSENQSEASNKNKNIIQEEIENEASVEDKNNVTEDSQMNDAEDETDSRLVLRGGVAECYNSYFRYIVVEGEKFYPYEDLVLKFGKIAMTHALQSRLPEKFRAYKCTEIEADFINKLEDTLPSLCVEATLLEEALFNKVACALEFFNSNTIVDLTEDGPPFQSSTCTNGTNVVNGLEVDLTQDDSETVSKMDIDEEINPSQDDSVLELTFDSQSDDENLQCSESVTKSTVSNDENLQYSESFTKSTVSNDENQQNIDSIKNDLSENMIDSEVDVEEKKNVEISQTTHENNPPMEEKDMDLVMSVTNELNQTEKVPCDSTSNIGNLGEMSRQISMTFEENNNNDHNEPSSLMTVENNDLAQQFSAMLSDLEKEFSVSSGSDLTTEEEISQISHMQKMIEEAINGMATDMTPSGTVNVDNEMDIRQAVKICMESFKDSNKDMTQAFLNILKQGVVYRAKFSSLKQQLTEFKSGTDKVLSSCDKYEDMLNKLKNTFQGEG